MAIPAPVPTPVTLPESHSSMMDIDVREEEEQHVLEEHEPAMKKLKRVHGEVEMVLRQTAEIVMVLVGVAALRGGAQPSPLECQLAAEAYEKLATLVAASAPQDLVSKDVLQSLIQQLTVPPPPPPARLTAPKPVSIQSQASRVSAPAASGPSPVPSPVSKEPAQAPPAQATTTPSPSPSPSLSPLPSPPPVSLSNASAPPVSVTSSAPTFESVAPAPAAPKAGAAAPASKAVTAAPKTVSPTPSPALGKTKALEDVQTSGPALDNSAAPSATPSSVPATNTNIPVATSATPSNTPKIKPGGWTSPVKHQGTPSAEAQPTTTTTTTTTTVVIKDQRGNNQAPKALARQRGLKNLVNNEPPPVTVVDPQQTHRQLALAVHLLLKPLIITPGLGKAAVNYLSVPVPCGICKVVVNTTNNCLVCDGCEGGFHLQCLQLSSSQSLPKSDWYCPKCVTTNAGRPQPPKYGPLRKGPAGPPGPKNSWAMQAGCGSDSSKSHTPGKLLLQSRKKEGDAVQVPALETCSTPNPEEDVAMEPDMEEHQSPIASTPTTSVTTSEQEMEPEKQPAQVVAVDDSIVTVEWVGPVLSTSQDKLFYSACSVGGETLCLHDTAFFRPEAPDVPPYIARLQALWEDKSSGQKWVKVNWCYNPSDLPVNMGRPVISDPREVYESNHSDNNLVGSIQGPCLVLSPLQYQEEMERRSKNNMEDPMPLFLCQWFYDAPRGLFRASSDAVS